MRMVKDETELPMRRNENQNAQLFLRSKIDPTVLMEYHDGDCFVRANGEAWSYPAYERTREVKLVDGVRVIGPWTALIGKGAYCDDKIYGTKAKAAA